jgi:hypothetical protein
LRHNFIGHVQFDLLDFNYILFLHNFYESTC